MYMYYILGFQVEQQNRFPKEHVYILALDGDVDFQPESLITLLARMERNPKKVGAACGRIHPVGKSYVLYIGADLGGKAYVGVLKKLGEM